MKNTPTSRRIANVFDRVIDQDRDIDHLGMHYIYITLIFEAQLFIHSNQLLVHQIASPLSHSVASGSQHIHLDDDPLQKTGNLCVC